MRELSKKDREAWSRLRGICKYYNIELTGWERCSDEDLYYLADRISFEVLPRPGSQVDNEEWDTYRAMKTEKKNEYYELLKKVKRTLI